MNDEGEGYGSEPGEWGNRGNGGEGFFQAGSCVVCLDVHVEESDGDMKDFLRSIDESKRKREDSYRSCSSASVSAK